MMWQERCFLEHNVELASSKEIQSDPQGFRRGRGMGTPTWATVNFTLESLKSEGESKAQTSANSLLRKMNLLE